jgi:hypothetical protein
LLLSFHCSGYMQDKCIFLEWQDKISQILLIQV